MTKALLRKIYLSKQRPLSTKEGVEKSRKIAEHFFERFDLSDTKILHSFIPIEKFNEVDTAFIIQTVWKNFPQVRTVVPRVNFDTAEIENVIYTLESETIQNIWDICEPIRTEIVEPKDIDIVLAPLLCFDKAGHRVGYGKGFYDRFLRSCRPDCLKVGLSYFGPVELIEDVHGGDVILDFVVTPLGVVAI